jgi:hypothetical protein
MSDRLEKRIEHLEELRDSLENLIAVASQAADKTTNNLVTKMEMLEKAQQTKDDKRWGSFKWAVGAAIFLLTIIVPINFLYMERLNNQIFVNTQKITVLETENKSQPNLAEIQRLFEVEHRTHAEIRELIKINTEKLTHVVTHAELAQLRKEFTEWFLQHIKEQHKK